MVALGLKVYSHVGHSPYAFFDTAWGDEHQIKLVCSPRGKTMCYQAICQEQKFPGLTIEVELLADFRRSMNRQRRLGREARLEGPGWADTKRSRYSGCTVS